MKSDKWSLSNFNLENGITFSVFFQPESYINYPEVLLSKIPILLMETRIFEYVHLEAKFLINIKQVSSSKQIRKLFNYQELSSNFKSNHLIQLEANGLWFWRHQLQTSWHHISVLQKLTALASTLQGFSGTITNSRCNRRKWPFLKHTKWNHKSGRNHRALLTYSFSL